MSWDRKVPFRRGHMLEWTDCSFPEVAGERDWGYAPDAWEDAEPFEARLKYTGNHKGRSAVRFAFDDLDRPGRSYSTGMQLIDELIPLMVNGEVAGRWTISKRGANFILIRAQESA